MTRLDKIARYVRERDKALLSLDKDKILDFYRKYNGAIPSALQDDKLFWCSVHKAITADINLPLDFRRKSKMWLTERGYHSLDDGEL